MNIFLSGENNILRTSAAELANREHINPAGKHTRFSRVTYFSYLH